MATLEEWARRSAAEVPCQDAAAALAAFGRRRAETLAFLDGRA